MPADLVLVIVALVGGYLLGLLHGLRRLRRLRRALNDDKERWWRYASAERAATLLRMRDKIDQSADQLAAARQRLKAPSDGNS